MTDKIGKDARNRPQVHRTLLAILCCVLLPVAARAQTPGDQRQASAVAEYVVQAGDVLSVVIWGWPTPSDRLEGKFPVESSGRVYLPVIGAVQVAGKTTERVQGEVRERLTAEQRQAVIVVEPLFAVGVNGAVTQPGVFEFRPGQTVFDALSRSGYEERADRTQVLLVRNGEPRTLSGANESELAALLARTPLQSGDRLVVHNRKRLASSTLLTVLQSAVAAVTLYTLLAK